MKQGCFPVTHASSSRLAVQTMTIKKPQFVDPATSNKRGCNSCIQHFTFSLIYIVSMFDAYICTVQQALQHLLAPCRAGRPRRPDKGGRGRRRCRAPECVLGSKIREGARGSGKAVEERGRSDRAPKSGQGGGRGKARGEGQGRAPEERGR